MNRKIRKHIQNIRDELRKIELIVQDDEPVKEEVEEIPEELINWTTADSEKADVYLKDLRDMTTLKDVPITGQIKTVFDLKSYVTDTGKKGFVYRVVLTDPTGDVTMVAFDDMATKLKEYTIGQYLRITNAWKMKENKHGVKELHIGNFAKIEVVE